MTTDEKLDQILADIRKLRNEVKDVKKKLDSYYAQISRIK